MSSSPQGPCIGNQQSLAHSRLWDAVVGFLHVFANMQMKLSQVLWPVPRSPCVIDVKCLVGPHPLVFPLWMWLLDHLPGKAKQIRSHL